MQDKSQTGRNKMGIMPIDKLLLSMAIPLMLSLLVQSLYNIVDSIFVARISEEALTATSLAYPIQILMIALAVGTSVGINALLSRLLGAGQRDEVGKAAATGLVLSLQSSLLFILAGSLAAGPIARLMSQDSEIALLCETYLRVCMLFCSGTFLETMVQRFLQASGRTTLSMISLVIGAGTNIILDPIMIFGYWGCPAMGIRGAAIATVIGQWLGAVTAILLNRFFNPDVPVSFRGFRLESRTVAAIYKVGFPTILMQAMGSIMSFGMNALLADATAVAFFGAYYKLQNFLFMPMNGLGQACLPIVGFNFGAKQGNRIRKVIRTALRWGVGIGLVGTVVFITIPVPLLRLFNASEAMLEIGVPAVRIICVTYALCSATTILGMCASGLGNGVVNMLGTGLRQVVLLLPCFALLLHTAGLPWAWFSMWIAELCAVFYAAWGVRGELRIKVEPLLNAE